jgi:methionyl-tRNA synthetase
VPGDEEQVIYVWFDALTNYITALDYAHDGPAYQRYWVDSDERIHLVGKDIIRFHALYWPAMLLSAGVPLPSQLWVHGFLTVEGQKISKSLGNVIDPVGLAEQYGIEPLRYYLLRKVPSTGDTDFTRDELVRTHNADLADQLGNLLSRVTKMIAQYCGGTVPAPGPLDGAAQGVIDLAGRVAQELDDAIAQFALHKALAALWELVGATNKYVVDVAPWRLARILREQGADPAIEQQLSTALYVLAEALRVIAHQLAPFLPGTADAIVRQLGVPLAANGEWRVAREWGERIVGARVAGGPVLFPKLAPNP